MEIIDSCPVGSNEFLVGLILKTVKVVFVVVVEDEVLWKNHQSF